MKFQIKNLKCQIYFRRLFLDQQFKNVLCALTIAGSSVKVWPVKYIYAPTSSSCTTTPLVKLLSVLM